jgi:hypothetical protein
LWTVRIWRVDWLCEVKRRKGKAAAEGDLREAI